MRPRRPRRPLLSQLTGIVGGVSAATMLLLALADGGFDASVWAQVTIVVWWTALVALLAGASLRIPTPTPLLLSGGALLGLAALSGASMLWASDLAAAHLDAVRGAGYVGALVLAAIAARAGAGRALLGGVALGLAVVAAIALLSRLEPGLVSGADEARALEVSAGRLSFPIGYWNALGACMAVAIPLLIWLGTSAATPRWRALATAAVPICSLTLFFTGSRGGALATAVGLAVLIAAGPRRVTLAAIAAATGWVGFILAGIAGQSPELVNGAQGSQAAAQGDQLLVFTILGCVVLGLVALLLDRRLAKLRFPVVGARRAAAALAVLGLLALAVLTPQLAALDDPPTTFRAAPGENRFSAVGGSGRTDFWRVAVDGFAEQPLRGLGAGGFEPRWAVHGPLEFTVTHAHSFFLEAAAELGVLGLVLTLVFVLAPLVAGVRQLRRPTAWADEDAGSGTVGAALAIVAALALAAGFDWLWDIPAAFLPLVLAGGYLCASPAGRRAGAASRRGGWRRRSALGLIAVAGFASIAAAGSLYLSERALDESVVAAQEGRFRDATQAARRASAIRPFASQPYRQIAVIESRRGRTAAARDAIASAQERATRNWELWLVEAGIHFQHGSIGRGIWALNRAQELNPKAPEHLFKPPTTLPQAPLASR